MHLPTPPSSRHPLGRAKCVWGFSRRSRIVLLVLACQLLAAPVWARQGLTAAWEANTDPYTVGYRLFGGTQSGVYSWNLDVGNATSAPVPALTQVGTYYFVVRAYNAAGEMGPASNEVSYTVGGGTPGVPTALSASSVGSRVTLTWGPPSTGGVASSYLLYVGTVPGASDLVSAYGVGNQLSASGDLGPGRYYARVQAANQFGQGPISSDVPFAVGDALPPSPPASLTMAWQGTVLTLTWGAAAGASSYFLEVGSVAGAANLGAISVGTATRYTVDVPPGTYHVRVRAANANGASAPSNEVVVQGRGAPNRPTNLVELGPVSGSTVNLRWTAPTGVFAQTGYVIEAGSGPGLADLAVLNLANVTTLSALAPPGTYYVRVRAVNARGASEPSNEIVVRR